MDSPIVTGDQPVYYNFHILEDSDDKLSHKHRGNHILDWMVSQDTYWYIAEMLNFKGHP